MATKELTIDQSIQLVIEQLEYVKTLTTDKKTHDYINMAIVRQRKLPTN